MNSPLPTLFCRMYLWVTEVESQSVLRPHSPAISSTTSESVESSQ